MTIYCKDQDRPVSDACTPDCGCNFMKPGHCTYCGSPYRKSAQKNKLSVEQFLNSDRSHSHYSVCVLDDAGEIEELASCVIHQDKAAAEEELLQLTRATA
jgi:hypothetical protein